MMKSNFIYKITEAMRTPVISYFLFLISYFSYTLMLRLPVSLKNSSMERTEVTVSTVE